jgi:hypothetical protein
VANDEPTSTRAVSRQQQLDQLETLNGELRELAAKLRDGPIAAVVDGRRPDLELLSGVERLRREVAQLWGALDGLVLEVGVDAGDRDASTLIKGIREAIGQWRSKLSNLAEYLELCQVEHPSSRLSHRFNQRRISAANSLRLATEGETVDLPGPGEAEDWLRWWQEVSEEERCGVWELLAYQEKLRGFEDFLAEMEGCWQHWRWHEVATAEEKPAPPSPEPELEPEPELLADIDVSTTSAPAPSADLKEDRVSRKSKKSASKPEVHREAAALPMGSPLMGAGVYGLIPEKLPTHRPSPPPVSSDEPSGDEAQEAGNGAAGPLLHEDSEVAAIEEESEPGESEPTLEVTKMDLSETLSDGDELDDEPLEDDEGDPGDEPTLDDLLEDVSDPRAQLERAVEFPTAHKNYSAFREHFWIAPDGQLTPVPWKAERYPERLSKAVNKALQRADFVAMWLHASALETLGQLSPLSSEEIRAMAAAWYSPGSFSAQQAGRGSELAQSFMDSALAATSSQRISAFLEALHPEPGNWLPPGEVDAFVKELEYADRNLERVIGHLYQQSRRQQDPVESLRQLGKRRIDYSDPKLIGRELDKARRAFRDEVRRRWSAAGGVVQRTHCRKAWTEFMEEAVAPLRCMYPQDAGGEERWDPEELARLIGSLEATHDEIADRSGAFLTDRNLMDRYAHEITVLAEQVNAWMRRRVQLESGLHERASGDEEIARAALKAFLSRGDHSHEETFYKAMLERVSREEIGGRHPLELTFSELLRCPTLLLNIPEDYLAGLAQNTPADTVICKVEQLREPVLASARLLVGSRGGDGATRSRLKQNELRLRLLGTLDEKEQAQLQGEWQQTLEALQDKLARLLASWHSLDEMGAPLANDLRQICDEAGEFLEQPDAGKEPFQPRLFEQWLIDLEGVARRAIQQARDQLKERVEKTRSDLRPEAEAAMSAGNFAEALRLLSGEPEASSRSSITSDIRATLWREEAGRRFKEPTSVLKRGSAAPDELVQLWMKGIMGGASRDRKLVRLFTEFVFAALLEENPGSREAQNSGEFEQRVKTRAIRDHIARRKLNPCFLPQLADASEIVLLAPQFAPSQGYFQTHTSNLGARLAPEMVVFLVPRLPAAVREKMFKTIHDRNIFVALIDDLDFARLLNPGGDSPDPLLGLMEIILEQQTWGKVDPFVPHEGQVVKMEMFVGRSHEATDLSRKPAYSRLFSGRKLGKSALLRYVANGAEKRLPSGKTLRVLYIPLAGIRAESEVVRAIFRELKVQIDFSCKLGPGADPGDALIDAMNRFISERPDESLLLVMDEADRFVEDQLNIYDNPSQRERCLTFRIRTSVESTHDEQGLPRVRFIVSGYRRTNTRGGAWANWSSVLILEPLQPDNAARLVAGPLARIGIDLGDHARTVAHRCGHQPAVLLRFGRELLNLLRDQGRGRDPTQIKSVTPEQVSKAFGRASVREEIRSVVDNNFQGNELGRVVFDTLLLVFGAVPPGARLDDVPWRIVERLRSLQEDALEIIGEDGTAEGRVRTVIQDLVERRLLQEEREGGTALYSLRFPHHLPVLLDQNLEEIIRASLAKLRERQGDDFQDRVLIPAHRLVAVRQLITEPPQDPELRVEAIIAGSIWPEALEDPGGGLPDRLGIEAGVCRGGLGSSEWKHALEQERAAFLSATPDLVEETLKRRDPALPAPLFIGGVELLRWGLDAEDGERMFEVVSTERLTRPSTLWWFTRVRDLTFAANAWDRIDSACQGLPTLMKQLDQLLLKDGRGGFDVSEARLEEVLTQLDGYLDDPDGPLSAEGAHLTQREREILRMMDHASSHPEVEEPGSWLGADWPLLEHDGELAPVGSKDHSALQFLLLVGLLPTDPVRTGTPLERLVKLVPGSPLQRLIRLPGFAP